MSFGGIVVASELTEEAIGVGPGFRMGVLSYCHDCLWLVIVLGGQVVECSNCHVHQSGEMS